LAGKLVRKNGEEAVKTAIPIELQRVIEKLFCQLLTERHEQKGGNMKPAKRVRVIIDLLMLLIALPLVGVVMAGMPIAHYLEFPPLTQYVDHAPFSWSVFILLAILIAGTILPFIITIIRSQPATTPALNKQAFPWWGWIGLLTIGANWIVAWNRFDGFAPFQSFTFSPFWFGYILVVNGLTWQRTGHCMLRDRPRYTSGLFAISAAFWWYFEYLNRFVQNWHYVGIGQLSGWQYFIYATLPFATVLPAVLGTREYLGTFPRLSCGLSNFIPVRVSRPRTWAGILFAASCLGLATIGRWPNLLYPLLWLSPLILIASLQCLRGQQTLFSDLAQGNWRNIVLLALAALVCGFFWELWNVHSQAKWIYTVPYVGRFKLFEMPILGYAGYLPFGLECAVVADFIFASPTRKDQSPQPSPPSRLMQIVTHGNHTIVAILAVYFFIAPGFLVMRDLADPRLKDARIPTIAWRLHRDLTPRYARWARERVQSGIAARLNLYDVPATEWPIFGSIYYLWATEALQTAWEQDHSLAPEAPAVYARNAIESIMSLVLDPKHHTWVKTHWGPDYLHEQNVFFRSLLIAACTSYENLIGDGQHLDLLSDQVESLSKALDDSPHGVLEDYPNECYPIDILAAIACIQRADTILGTDHTPFINRAYRAFSGHMLDACGLPPYLMDADSATHLGPSRGIGNSYILIFAPELWPNAAATWYRQYEEHFWQTTWWAEGWREYPRTLDPKFASYMDGRFLYDVDAGPIIAGFSPAANAFGLAAASINGRLDHAYTLGTQVIAATWPLPNGSLLGPRLLSSQQHAPYLGEACLLFFLSQTPNKHAQIIAGGKAPACVTLGLVFYLGTGGLLLVAAGIATWRYRRQRNRRCTPLPQVQFSIWLGLLSTAIWLAVMHRVPFALLFIAIALLLPYSQVIEKREE
jgi:hypothetical protein